MIKENIKNNNSGFALLFAVTLSAILLSIALGVSQIALKELKFSTSARSTNEAFFAADTGIECALFHDKSTVHDFRPGTEMIQCASQDIDVINSEDDTSYSFTILHLGNNDTGCAKVTLRRNETGTTIVSKGYDVGDENCNSSNQIEREVNITY